MKHARPWLICPKDGPHNDYAMIAPTVPAGWRPDIDPPPLSVWRCKKCGRFVWTPTHWDRKQAGVYSHT